MDADELLRGATSHSERTGELEGLLNRPNDELFALVYARTVQPLEPKRTADDGFRGPDSPDEMLRSSEAIQVGRRIFQRWSKTLHAFVCTPEKEDADLRAQLISAIVGKGGGAAAIVAGTLVASFGLSPALAALIAALVLKLIVAPAADELCATWQTYNAASAAR